VRVKERSSSKGRSGREEGRSLKEKVVKREVEVKSKVSVRVVRGSKVK
jgi:hypothetical protein